MMLSDPVTGLDTSSRDGGHHLHCQPSHRATPYSLDRGQPAPSLSASYCRGHGVSPASFN